MKLAILSVSRQGFALSKNLLESYPQAEVYTSGPWQEAWARIIEPDLKTLTGRLFSEMDALVYIMASGIAVRMVAPYLKGKDTDPAVIVMDDHGKWVIPLLSGHLGGANALAQEIAGHINAQAVVTTATDGKGLTAVDMLAQRYHWTITSLEAAKKATAALLEGETIRVYTGRQLSGELPEGYELSDDPDEHDEGWKIIVTPYTHEPGEKEVWLIPRCITLGMGCRKDAGYEAVQSLVSLGLEETGLDPRAVSRIASIDLKAAEPALIRLSNELKVPLVTYSAEALSQIALQFPQSEFVKNTTGVGAVSEPAGSLASGGRCLLPKRAADGVTLSIWEDC